MRNGAGLRSVMTVREKEPARENEQVHGRENEAEGAGERERTRCPGSS